MAIKCHSAFVHYNMYHNNHCHGGGNNFGSIFNITNNCGGGHTSFWGGLGAGLGFGLGGLFGGIMGGIMGGFGNMFGGFGMGNMFGMGGFGNLFGGWGNGLSSLWGGGNSGADSDYSDYSSRRSSKKSSCDCGCKDKKAGETPDADCQKIADFQEEINNLKGPLTEDTYNEIKKRIEVAKEASTKDPNNKEANLKSYDELLEALDKLKPNAGTVTPGGSTAPVNDKPTVKIDGKDVAIDDLTAEQIDKLTEDQITSLTEDQARQLLKILGLTCKDDNGKDGVQATTNLNALRLTKQAGWPLACGHNTSLDEYVKDGALPYLSGGIDNIVYDENTKMITFELEDEKGKYQMQCSAGSTQITLVKELENKDEQYKEADKNIVYTINTTDNDPFAVRTGQAAKKKK